MFPWWWSVIRLQSPQMSPLEVNINLKFLLIPDSWNSLIIFFSVKEKICKSIPNCYNTNCFCVAVLKHKNGQMSTNNRKQMRRNVRYLGFKLSVNKKELNIWIYFISEQFFLINCPQSWSACVSEIRLNQRWRCSSLIRPRQLQKLPPFSSWWSSM